MRLEFKLPPGGNNGLAIRADSPDGDAAYEAVEIQVLDDTDRSTRTCTTISSTAACTASRRRRAATCGPSASGTTRKSPSTATTLSVRLNGFEILNANLAKVREKPVDGQEHPGAARTSGHFGFCGHNDPVAFRNIRIKRLASN